MANRIMDEDCRQPAEDDSDATKGKQAAAAEDGNYKDDNDDNAAVATTQDDVHGEKNNNNNNTMMNNNKNRRRVSRTSSMGGVRRIIEKRFRKISHLMNDEDEVKTARQWSQRLQDHLQEKKMLGPSTHERQIRKRTFDPFDGEGSNPDLLLGTRDRGNKSSSARLEGSISADLIISTPASWLSPKKSSSSSRNNSYSNLDDDNLHKHLNNNKPPPNNSRTRSNNNNDSKSLIFPPPPQTSIDANNATNSSPIQPPQCHDGGGGGSSNSNSFDGGDDFMNMSSGPLNTNSFSLMDMNASNEFKILRQPQEEEEEEDSPPEKKSPIRKRSYTPPQSRKSLFGSSSSGNNKGGGGGKPVVGPKFSKQLTDFRLRRQSKVTGSNIKEEDGNFSVTTEKSPDISDRGTNNDLPGGGARGNSSEGDDDDNDNDNDDPAKDSSRKNYQIRRLHSSAAEQRQQHVENMLHNQQHQRHELAKEIELRREKFRDKLAGLRSMKENNTTTTTTGLASAFAKDLQQTIDKNIKDLQEADDVSMPSLTLDALVISGPTAGRRPSRSLSESSAALSRKMDFGSGSLDSVALMATMFDDDDSLFFATAATTGKMTKPKFTTTTTTTTPQQKEDDDGDAVLKSALPSSPPPSDEAATIKKSTSFPSKPTTIKRCKTTSDLEKQPLQDASMIIPNATFPEAALITTNQTDILWQRNNRQTKRSGGSNKSAAVVAGGLKSGRRDPIKSENATGTGGSNHRRTQESNNPTQLSKPGKFKRRATVHVAAAVDLEQSFQIGESQFKEESASKFNSSFQNSNLDKKDSTTLFDQSFVLGSPTKSLSHGRIVNIDTEEMPNLFEESNAPLSTVNEVAPQHDGNNKRPKRRNSLPTGSSHGPAVPKAALHCSPTNSKPKLTTSKTAGRDGGAKTPPPRRSRRRHSVQGPDLEKSFAQLGIDSETADAPSSKSKSNASVVSTTTSATKANGSVAGSTVVIGPEEEAQILAATKLMGLAPPPADSATPRRRTSIGVPSAVSDCQADRTSTTTVDKIRARRRESTRVSTRNEKNKLRMKDNSESVVSSRRRTDRKSKRRTASVERSSDGRDTPIIKEEPSKNPNGTLNRKSRGEMKDESRKKHSGMSTTPNAPRRTRRASIQVDSGGAGALKTARSKRKTASEGLYKPRPRGDFSPKLQSSILSPSTPRMRALNRGMDDDSQLGRSRTTMDDGSQIGRSARRGSARPVIGPQSSIDESESKSEEMSDDSDYEPTPKPAAPPSLPRLSTRKKVAGSTVRGAESGRPRRRSKSASKSRRRKSEYTNRKDKEADLPDLVAPSSSAERRKTRNRRHAANEALKESGETSPLAGIVQKAAPVDTEATGGLDTIQSPEQDPARLKKTVDKNLLLAELCRSPNKANRFRRHKTTSGGEEAQKDEAVTKSPGGRSSRKNRRAKSDENRKASDATKSPKTPSMRRRKTEANVEVTPLSNRSRLRRVKTDDGTLPSINLEVDMEEAAAEKKEAEARKGKGGIPVIDGNASNRFMLKGISF